MNRTSGNPCSGFRLQGGAAAGKTHGSRGAAILLLATALILPQAAFSERSAGPFSGPSAAGGETLLFQEIPSVYGASKYEQKITEAPSSVSVVTSEEIRKFGYRTLADIIRAQRGFYVNYDRNYHYIGIRGFLRPGDYNSRVLLLVDGHRTNDPIYETAYIGTAFSLDIDLIDRVEFIRGPSSSLYGSNAFFGVINVITRRGRNLEGAELSGEAGSQKTYKSRATYGNQGQSGLEGIVSGTWYGSKGDDRLFFREFDDPATNNGVAENSDGDRFYSAFTTLSWRDFTLQGAWVDRTKQIPTAPWGTFFNDNRTESEDGMAYVDLKYDRYFGTGWSVLARANYNYYWYFGDYVYDANGDPLNPDLYVNRDEARAKWIGTELTMRKRIGEKHKLTFGAEYRSNYSQDQSNFDVTDPRVDYLNDRRDSYFWAVYVQDDFEILKGLILNAGIRHDHYSTFGGTTNPRIALIANPRQGSTVKLLYGRSFRAPSVSELYYHDGNLTTKASPDLDPETIDMYELVCEQSLGANIRGTATGYYYKVKKLINSEIDPNDGLLVFQNLGTVKSFGASAELEGRWESGFQGRASYSYQESEDDATGQELENSPRHAVKVNLNAPIIKEMLFAGAEVQFMSSRATVQGSRAGGVWFTNLTLSSGRLRDRWEFSASLYNLFDEEFGDPGSTEHVQALIPQDGRTFRVKVTLTL